MSQPSSPPRFEIFVALRYLRAKRKQAVLSVITAISILGVAAGVMALVIALAINAGFRSTLQRNLLGATAHFSILEKQPGYGIQNWSALAARLRRQSHVTAIAPALYGSVLMAGPLQSTGAVLKGVDLESARSVNAVLNNLKAGSFEALSASGGMPGLVMGARLAQDTGMQLGSVIRIVSPQGDLTPFGPRLTTWQFRVVGIFESGFYELDAHWAFTSLKNAQNVFSTPDVVNTLEGRVDALDLAPEVARAAEKEAGSGLMATHWMEQNRQILGALRMEKIVTIITIGLIQLVAALNILIALVMMVMEKQKDIAILVAMGARRSQIRSIFMLQGLTIGVIGTMLGLVAGYTICYFAGHYHWIPLDPEIYSLSFVPFEPRASDGLWIAAIAMFVSLTATLYPARNAARIAPAEALRYE